MAKPFMCGDEFPVYIPEGGCDCNYSLISVTDDQYAVAYSLTLNGERVGEQISIPKDMVVESGVVNTCIEDGTPYPGAIAGDKYLMLSIANSDTPIYVSLKELQTGGYLVVDELPAEGDGQHIYLVENGSGYDRYVWVDGEWINLGNTEIDLSNYYTKAEVNSGFYTKQEVDALIPTIPDAHPVGSVVVTDTNTNPSSQFGGSWTLIDKEFKSQYIDSGAVAWQTGSNTSYAFTVKGQEIWFHATFNSTIQFTDTDIPIVHITLSKIGLSDCLSCNALGYSDTGGGVLMLQAQKYSSTILRITSLDVVTHNSTPGIMPSGMTIRIDCPIRFVQSYMLDSFCDRFFWKRTA